MLRDEWKFEYSVAQLLEAATAQLAFRNQRVDVWEAKKLEVIERIKASGINVNESLTELMNQNTAKYLGTTRNSRSPQISIDETMKEDLHECYSKIQQHTELRNQYRAWVQIFSGEERGERRIELQHDDWMFFFGK